MSVNAPTLELNQLIYRHLKENGFCSAAEELQRHNPQEETNISVSLLDIYRSWLRDSKKKRPNSAKRSKSQEKGQTSTKGKPATPKKKADKSAKTPPRSKKSTPLKRKKGEAKKESAVKAKKPKPSAADKADGGDGSDSDSSLDVEKWKKLILQMTDVDVVKMESINALDATPPPKKKRVRKPRAKPPTKADTPVQQSNEENAKDEEKSVTQTPEKSILKKRRGSAAHVSSETPVKTQNLNKNQQPETSAISPKKLTKAKDAMISESVGEEKSDETASEPKKKRKEKRASEYNMKRDGNDTEKGKREGGKGKKISDVTEQEAADTPAQADRKRALTETALEKDQTNVEDISESAPREEKAKKKKKVKPRCEETEADMVEEKKMVDSMETSELNSAETIQENSDKGYHEERLGESVKEKKAKRKRKTTVSEDPLQQAAVEEQDYENSELGVKKKKAKKTKEPADTEESPEIVIQEKKAKRKKAKNPDEDISEQKINESTNEKEVSVQTGEDIKPPMETLDGIKQEQPENTQKKKKKQHDFVDVLTPADQETSTPTKRKKKKNKLKSEEAPEEAVVSADEATATQTTLDGSHKKKKKSKSSDS